VNRTTHNPWLHRFAIFTSAATLALIGLGGLVTSHGVGMAVPDWPTTYGYNMFLFPPSQWIGGIFYEHTHRLLASFVGLLTTILAVWLWLKEERRWLRWLGVAAFFAVVFQGILGGLRVTLYKAELGIFHATLAQLFLMLVVLIAIFTSRSWQDRPALPGITPWLRRGFFFAVILILGQLALGAAMRHQHAGLAVRDFPLAHGKLWPPMDEASIEAINRARIDVRDFHPVTAFQIGLHMAHRIGAVVILTTVWLLAWQVWRRLGSGGFSRLAILWAVLILGQGVLGAATVLSNKAADVATLHVVAGAVSLAWGALLCALTVPPLRAGIGAGLWDAAPGAGVAKPLGRQRPASAY
jgi:heme a synthase